MLQHNILLPGELKVISEDNNKAVCEIGGLYPGFGHTLGNSLRRVILSSIPGVSVTKIFIKGVPHEFTTIDGVKEDVINIILNLKRVVFKLDSTDSNITLNLKVKGKKEVTAKDIELPSQVEILNPDQYLFTISKGYEFDMSFEIAFGLGYVPKEVIKDGQKVSPEEIVLDTSFTPIRRISYEVENMRVGDRTDFNKIIFKIETDGSVTPVDAIKQSIQIMIEQLQAVSGQTVYNNQAEEKHDSIVQLELDESILTKLAGINIINVDDLAQIDEKMLLDSGFSDKEVSEINKALKK